MASAASDNLILFQSAPLTEARGDIVSVTGRPRWSGFNPLPSPKQGETFDLERKGRQVGCFNPLPSPKQGETLKVIGVEQPEKFQSAPLTEARGDSSASPSLSGTSSFNPLPSPKQGETKHLQLCARTDRVSIRSPHRSKGRPDLDALKRYTNLFQSAPLTEARGDWNPASRPYVSALFQSAPLTEARGDAAPTPRPSPICGFNPLPSPKQGETIACGRSAASQQSFNPLPSPKQGETKGLPPDVA